MRNLLLLLLLLTTGAYAESMVTIGGVSWYTDYDQAMAVARAEGKPMWLHFGENPG